MGSAVVTDEDNVWATAIPSGTSAQKAELIAMTKVLEMAEGKKLNVYTDSCYAFATAHVYEAIYQELRLLTTEGKTVKNKQVIIHLLASLWLPTKLAIIRCLEHERTDTPMAGRNQRAD